MQEIFCEFTVWRIQGGEFAGLEDRLWPSAGHLARDLPTIARKASDKPVIRGQFAKVLVNSHPY